jgi:hypothetical protein
MPISGLYMCGSGTHPGGGVMGIPGFDVSRVAIRDAKGEELEESAFRDSARVQERVGKGRG